MMYHRILIPVDDSPTSSRALQEAIKFASDQHALVRLLHVADLGQFTFGEAEFFDTSELQRTLLESGERVLAAAATLLTAAGVEHETVLQETYGDRVARLITDHAKEWAADIIVMGTHGRRGFDSLIMGSVADGVVRAAEVPVLLVRAGE